MTVEMGESESAMDNTNIYNKHAVIDGTVDAETAISLDKKPKENHAADDTNIPDVLSEDGVKNKYLPIDRGWAWVVLVACFFECAIIVGYFKCFGIFFVQLQRRFSSTSAATSVIFSLQNAFYSLSALLVMNLGQSMPSRFYVVLGSTVVSATFFITGFAESLKVVYITGGMLSGAFLGCMQPHVSAMINTYFEKYRGMANNLAGSGVSIGALSMAPLYTMAFEYYGFTNTYILVAGLTLQVAVIGMLLRPLEYYHNKSKNVRSAIALNRCEEVAFIADDTVPPELKAGNNIYSRNLSHSDRHGSISLISKSRANAKEDISEDVTDAIRASTHRCVTIILHIQQKLFKSSVLKKRVFLYYLLCNVFVCCGCVIVEAFIAPLAVDMDINNERIAILISSMAIADICSKVFFAYLSDRKWIKRSTIMALAAFVLGLCSFFMFFLNTFAAVLVYAIIAGSLQPVYFVLYPVVAVDILSLEELKSALGFLAVTQGVTVSVCFPFAGYLRDLTGRYYASFCFAGSMLIIGGTLCFFLPNVKTLCDRKSEQTVCDPENEKTQK